MDELDETPAPFSGFESAVACERAFYEAFAARDLAAMAAVWAEEELSCIHPGAGVLRTRAAILASWAEIFADAPAPRIRVHILSRIGEAGLAVHTVQEQITQGAQTSHVLATNVFRRGREGWRMLAHHGSVPVARRDAAAARGSLH